MEGPTVHEGGRTGNRDGDGAVICVNRYEGA